MLPLYWMLPGVLTLAACWLGYTTRSAGGSFASPWLWRLVGIAAVIVGWIALSARESGVSSGDVVFGSVLAVLFLGVLPVVVAYAFGFATEHARVVGVAWFVGTIPLAFYTGVGWIIVAGLVACPPGAYECPI